MSERRTQPSSEPVYSEADLAEFRQDWEAAQEKRQVGEKLSRLEGQMSQLPELVKAQVRTVLAEEKTAADAKRRADLRLGIGAAAALLVVVVPFEQVLLNLLFRGHP